MADIPDAKYVRDQTLIALEALIRIKERMTASAVTDDEKASAANLCGMITGAALILTSFERALGKVTS